jgi:signal transduction histidine kinase
MRGVVLNLVQNAAAATEGRGRVRVSIEREAGWSRLRVRDEGAGVPEELREEIFEPFFTTRAQGSGLGLTVARHAVEQHGGRLRLDPAPGGGTDAVVELPAVSTDISRPPLA